MVDPVSAALLPWVIYCDGSALPNPGRMGLGAVFTEPDGTRHTLSQATHRTGCNNEAELRALMVALQQLQKRGATALLVYSDSSVLVEQLGAANAKPIARLAALFDEARALLNSFEQASLQWIPGHRNGEADALARAALGMPPRRPAKLSKNRR
jgi:ribonuclease HI